MVQLISRRALILTSAALATEAFAQRVPTPPERPASLPRAAEPTIETPIEPMRPAEPIAPAIAPPPPVSVPPQPEVTPPAPIETPAWRIWPAITGLTVTVLIVLVVYKAAKSTQRAKTGLGSSDPAQPEPFMPNASNQQATPGDAPPRATHFLQYRDADDQLTQRHITLRGVDRGSFYTDLVFLRAWCHLRGDDRTFRRDRIVGVFDPATGEDMGDPEELFRLTGEFDRKTHPDHKALMARASRGLKVLSYVARAADGISADEIEVMLDYVMTRAEGLSPEIVRSLDRRAFGEAVEGLDPDRATAFTALGMMTRGELDGIGHAINRIVMLQDDGKTRRRAEWCHRFIRGLLQVPSDSDAP